MSDLLALCTMFFLLRKRENWMKVVEIVDNYFYNRVETWGSIPREEEKAIQHYIATIELCQGFYRFWHKETPTVDFPAPQQWRFRQELR